MQWLGWILAVAAIGVAIWLKRQLATAQAHAGELLYEKIDAENALEAQLGQGDTPAGERPFRAVVEHLDAPLESMRDHLLQHDAQLVDYRELIQQYDAAVQYCLQPVELILGADKASLDELVQHVEGARRKLFDARSALERNPLHVAGLALTSPADDVQAILDYVHALDMPPAAEAQPRREPVIDAEDEFDATHSLAGQNGATH